MNKENAAGIEMELKETFDVQLSRAISSHHHHYSYYTKWRCSFLHRLEFNLRDFASVIKRVHTLVTGCKDKSLSQCTW